MAKFGYIMTAPGYNDFESDGQWMTDFGCVEIVRETLTQHEGVRTLWDSLIGRLQTGDTIVIPKLSNAVKGTRQLVFFLELCRVNNIRLVSIHDRIDSHDELFPDAKTSDVLTAIALLPKEANAIRKSDTHVLKIRRQISEMSQKAVGKAERNRRVINMYQQGFSIDDIFAESGFKSRSSVFRVLNDANIDLNRGNRKGPLGPRRKKTDEAAEEGKV